MDPTQPPSSDELQFDKAEMDGASGGALTCQICGRPLHDIYFEVNGRPSCEKCRYDVEAERSRASGAGRFARALVGGGIGALVGAGIYYAVLALTGYEVGIVAIAVGFLVGAGVRWGSRGRGGWVYQGLAITLTYVAIVSTYVPLVFEELEKMDETELAESQAAGAPGAAGDEFEPARAPGEALVSEADAEAAVPEELPDISAGEALVALVLFGLFVLALPFLGGFENIIGLVIIGIALYQAWAMNKRQALLIEGPLQVGKTAQSPPVSPGDTAT
jgi:hypothetical protein